MSVPGLSSQVRKAIYAHVFENDDREVGGVLIGRLGDSALPVVTGSIAALEADGQRASVTFTHDAWASIHHTLERDFPEQQIVGWYHSHPGFGIFLSEYDRFIHGNFFADRRQIAYVIDPHAGTEGVFRWQGDELVLLAQTGSGRRVAGVGGHGRHTATHRGRGSPRPGWIGYAAAVGVLAALAVVAILLVSTAPPARHALHRVAGPALASTNGVVPGGVAATTRAGAPAYCKKLVGDKSLTGMSSALTALAKNPQDASAQAALRSAAASLRSLSAQMPARDRPAITSAANAIDAVAAVGLSKATKLQNALTRVGRTLQRACGFPIG